MSMTEEHKAKLAAGRERARLLRQNLKEVNIQNTLPQQSPAELVYVMEPELNEVINFFADILEDIINEQSRSPASGTSWLENMFNKMKDFRKKYNQKSKFYTM